MPFLPEEREQVLKALNQRIPQISKCEVCGHYEWTLADGYVFFALQDSLSRTKLGGPGLPSVALVCNFCGNTRFLNVIVLGLGSLVQKQAGA